MPDRDRAACSSSVSPARPRLSLVLALLLGAVAFAALGLGLTVIVRRRRARRRWSTRSTCRCRSSRARSSRAHSFPGSCAAIADVLPLTYFIRLIAGRDAARQTRSGTRDDVAVVAAWGLARGHRRACAISAGSRARVRFACRADYTSCDEGRAADCVLRARSRTAGGRGPGQLRHLRGTRGDSRRDRRARQALLPKVGEVAIVAEQRHEIGEEAEALC